MIDLVNATICVSVLSIGLSCVYAGSRTLTALAETGYAPRIFAYGKPYLYSSCNHKANTETSRQIQSPIVVRCGHPGIRSPCLHQRGRGWRHSLSVHMILYFFCLAHLPLCSQLASRALRSVNPVHMARHLCMPVRVILVPCVLDGD